MRVLVVESPNKVKKLQGFLDKAFGPKSFIVVATVGHFRGLPPMDGQAFSAVVDPLNWQERFELSKPDVAKRLVDATRHAEQVYLASDPDREGEAIAWHVAQHCRLAKPKRVCFTELTERAVVTAINDAREIDLRLVDAQRARQVLDYELGLELSRRLWRFSCKSAGRVQSAALRIVVDREQKIRSFKATEYFTLQATYDEGFIASVAEFAAPTDEEADDTGVDRTDRKLVPRRFETQAEVQRYIDEGRGVGHHVEKLEQVRTTRRPPPPFTTASMQAVASTQLGFDADKTAKLAQTLFEAGLVTYIRTDSTSLSTEAVDAIRDHLRAHHPELLPDVPQVFADKQSAQAAHEAIRPTDINAVGAALPGDERALYNLIRSRTIACQARSAELLRTTVCVRPGQLPWRLLASGVVVKQAGFLSLSSDHGPPEEKLPSLVEGQPLQLKALEAKSGKTKPPPRFTQASLIRYLERREIGRPATYAAIFKTLFDREYVEQKKAQLVPLAQGELAVKLLSLSFDELTQEAFTATTESVLDAIADGKTRREHFLAASHARLVEMLQHADVSLAEYEKANPTPRRNEQPLKTLKTPCSECGGRVVEQPYKSKSTGKMSKYYRCEQCPWKSSFPPPAKSEWPCHADASHGPMLEVPFTKDGKHRVIFRCPVCKGIANSGPIPPPCPKCGRETRLKAGQNGAFFGCAAFQETGCRGAVDVQPKQKTQATQKPTRTQAGTSKHARGK